MALPATPAVGTKKSGLKSMFAVTNGGSAVGYNSASWDFDDGVDLLDVMDSSSQGYKTEISGPRQGSGTINYYFDGSAPWPFTPDAQIVNLALIIDNTLGSVAINCPLVNVESITTTVDVKDVTKCAIKFKTSGPYSYSKT